MKTRISFGKIAYTNPNRKANEVTVDIELRDCTTKAGYPYKELAISGDIWNTRHTDCVCGGQCLDTIAEYVDIPLFKEIHDLWNKHHLNDMHAGTPQQTAAVYEWLTKGNSYDYVKIKEYLKSIELDTMNYTGHGLAKDYDNEPYTYGTDWLICELPETVIKRVTEIIETNR